MANRIHQDPIKVMARQMLKVAAKAAKIEDRYEKRRRPDGSMYPNPPMRLIKRLAKKYESLDRRREAALAYHRALEG